MDRRLEISNQIQVRHNDYRFWYGDDYWRRHPHVHYHFHSGFDCWRWTAWGPLSGWFVFGWSQPVYYYYGENVYYQNNSVYYGDQVVCSATEYVQQASNIVQSAPQDIDEDKLEWMSLGVFALTQDGEDTGADPTMFLQLAVSKEGIIAGSLQNTATGSVQSIEGMVDKATQRAAWTVSGKKWPIMETGIYNLTQDTGPALVHFEDGGTQQWLLVRLQKPEDPAAPTPPSP